MWYTFFMKMESENYKVNPSDEETMIMDNDHKDITFIMKGKNNVKDPKNLLSLESQENLKPGTRITPRPHKISDPLNIAKEFSASHNEKVAGTKRLDDMLDSTLKI